MGPGPPSSPQGERLSTEEPGETSRAFWHKVHEIRDGKGAFLSVGMAPLASRPPPAHRRSLVGMEKMASCAQMGEMADL